ncbi:MAG: phospho-sugar mutase, partial [Spirochaetota bacterium]
MELSSDAKKRIQEWTSPPFDEATINEIKSLVEQKNYYELNERFGAELEFGTGGLRGIIRNGS